MTALTQQIEISAWIDPAEIPALAQSGVRTIINNRPDHEQPGQALAVEAQRVAAAHGVAYYHIPVTVDGITEADIAAFHAALVAHEAKYGEAASAKILAHCRSGARAVNLWALARIHGDRADPASIAAIAQAGRFDLGMANAWLARHSSD